MAWEDNVSSKGGRKRYMNRKAMTRHRSFDREKPAANSSCGVLGETFKAKKALKHQEGSAPWTSFLRKQVDPETAKYFSEIANVLEGAEVDLEERSYICGNALEETGGKEVELATDYILSHTLQTLLEGCDVFHLCAFVRSCSKDFPCISMDKSGSHVVETALKSLHPHLQDSESHLLVEVTLRTLIQTIVVNPIDVMCNCYGSHVLRSLLCLCKGFALDSSEFHSKKASLVLADRLNFSTHQKGRDEYQKIQHGFPGLLKFLVTEMIQATRNKITILQADQYGSLVLQTALKLIAGWEQELLLVIPILLGCCSENAINGSLIEVDSIQKLLNLMKETAFSHLMEVILEVAPVTLYSELLTKVFKGSLLEMSLDQCGSFVVQALISHARSEVHTKLILKELGANFKELLRLGRSGVVASLLAASHRLHTREHKCCQALIDAVCMENESPRHIVSRILFLDDYFCSPDKASWNWPNGAKMHLIGSLILQSVFRLPSEFICAFISSITSLEAEHVLEASKDPGGSRVVEAFLGSNASGKQKCKLVIKLQGCFGKLSLHQSGSYIVEKCFNVSNLSVKEMIVSDLLAVQTELSKTKQGPHLLRKLDVEEYTKRADLWKSRQASKESAYKEFISVFGSKEEKPFKNDLFLADSRPKSQKEKLKDVRKEIASSLSSSVGSQFLSQRHGTNLLRKSGVKHRSEEPVTQQAMEDGSMKSKHKRQKEERKGGGMAGIA